MIADIAESQASPEQVESKSALVAFGRAMAERPIDLEVVAQCREKLRSIGGDELVLESCIMIGNFAATSRCVDVTGRTPLDAKMLKKIKKIITFMIHRKTIALTLAAVIGLAVVGFGYRRQSA